MRLTDEYRRLHYLHDEPLPACAGEYDLFDPPELAETRGEYRERAALARKLCHWCPILDACAERVAALTNRDKRGFTCAGVTYNSVGDPITSSSKDTAT